MEVDGSPDPSRHPHPHPTHPQAVLWYQAPSRCPASVGHGSHQTCSMFSPTFLNSSSMHQMQPGIPQCISPWPAAAMDMLDVSVSFFRTNWNAFPFTCAVWFYPLVHMFNVWKFPTCTFVLCPRTFLLFLLILSLAV